MFKLENLHDQSLKEIIDESKEKIAQLNSEWTYSGESDPGITLIELFSWLKFVQHEYLNKISPITIIKFLKLIGIQSKKNRGSHTLIEISEAEKETRIPKNTKWLAGNLVFENEKSEYLTSAHILNVEFNNPEETLKIEYYKFDGIRIFFLFGQNFRSKSKNREFIINFGSPLPKNKKINIYFKIFNIPGMKRNSINNQNNDEFVPMAQIIWEYWGTENGQKGWHKAKFKDKTYNFLFSGIINLKLKGFHEASQGFYPIRARLLRSDYDFPPQITKILVNIFEVNQKNTVCEKIFFKKNQIKYVQDEKNQEVITAEIKISTHLSIYGESLFFIKKNDSWIPENNFSIEKDIESGLVYLRTQNTDFLKEISNEQEVFMLISYDKKIRDKVIIGDGKGFSPQIFNINFEKEILYDSFEIIIGEQKNYETFFKIWKRVDEFFASNKNDRHFIYEKTSKTLVFGDHINGASPRAGKDNIIICSLAFTEGEASNIKKELINKAKSDNEVLKHAWIRQITEAKGGKDDETFESVKKRSTETFSKINRIVTIEDYKKIVLSTPGMFFKTVSILPTQLYKNQTYQSAITVIAQCGDSLKLTKSCKKTIALRLEKYRLLGTKINIIGPEIIIIDIKGKFAVNSAFKEEDHIIEKKIERFFEKLNRNFGQPLKYNKIFSKIENLDCMNYIYDLVFSPSGKCTVKQDDTSGDILVPPNVIYKLRKFNLNFFIGRKY
ncbi:MAG: baseplate J/gp47 family protein [Oscillospiraceae bacterium]|jgi:hypothetical protein|nr:baseplate J/gp47 family protein [Oscillospiraceae bacterium]